MQQIVCETIPSIIKMGWACSRSYSIYHYMFIVSSLLWATREINVMMQRLSISNYWKSDYWISDYWDTCSYETDSGVGVIKIWSYDNLLNLRAFQMMIHVNKLYYERGHICLDQSSSSGNTLSYFEISLYLGVTRSDIQFGIR